MHLYMYCGIF